MYHIEALQHRISYCSTCFANFVAPFISQVYRQEQKVWCQLLLFSILQKVQQFNKVSGDRSHYHFIWSKHIFNEPNMCTISQTICKNMMVCGIMWEKTTMKKRVIDICHTNCLLFILFFVPLWKNTLNFKCVISLFWFRFIFI